MRRGSAALCSCIPSLTCTARELMQYLLLFTSSISFTQLRHTAQTLRLILDVPMLLVHKSMSPLSISLSIDWEHAGRCEEP